MNKLFSFVRKVAAFALAAVGLASVSHATDSGYASVDAAVTAAQGLPATATTIFLSALTLGLGIVIVRIVVKMVKRGVSQ